jgi:hypothetical protein
MDQDEVVRSPRALMVAGTLCLLVAGSGLLFGFTDTPWLTLVSALIGSILLTAALVGVRAGAARPKSHDPARGERLVWVAALVLAGFGVVATLVALLVAVGEARGHAVAHLITGLLCLGLFAALAFPWHPPAGSGAATLRGLVLTLLVLAAFGSFLESLGGAGYDAANDGRRIEVLAKLHDIAVPLGAFLIVAVPLGVITGMVVLIARATRRGQALGT